MIVEVPKGLNRKNWEIPQFMTHIEPTHFENFHLQFLKVRKFIFQIFFISKCLETCKESVSGNNEPSICFIEVIQSATRDLKKIHSSKIIISRADSFALFVIFIHYRNFNVYDSPSKKAPWAASLSLLKLDDAKAIRSIKWINILYMYYRYVLLYYLCQVC